MRVSLLVAAAVVAALLSLLVAPSVAAHGDHSIDMMITEMERATEGELDFDVLLQMASSVDNDAEADADAGADADAAADVSVSGCNNSPPDNKYTCVQQKEWGKCNESWMKGHCELTCGTCKNGGSGCKDVSPPGDKYTCTQQKDWGKCGESWMSGYCKKSCGTCGSTGGGSAPAGNSKPSASLKALKIKGDSSRTAPLKSYGSKYKANKAKVMSALKKAGFSKAQQVLFLAIAMLETNTMDPAQRDTGKTGASTNYSLWNVCRDMIEYAGKKATADLNTWKGVNKMAALLRALLKKYGVNPFLNFLRGGRDGFRTTTAYGCVGYRNAIASMVRIIDQNPSLLTDDRRIDMSEEHV